MSSRGRKPTPTAVKQLRGNPGKRPMTKREPKPKTAVKRPHGLGQGLQRRFWDEHAPELERLQILTGVDAPMFRLAAEHYAIAVQAAQELRKSVEDGGGLTVEGRDGAKKNPLFQVFRDSSMAFKAFATEFGMTPSARARLQLPEEAEQMSLAEMLFQAVSEDVETSGD